MRLICTLIFLSLSNAFAVDLSQLDRTQKERLFKGEFVMLAHEVKDAAWPKLEIYRLVESDPLSFAAFFADFEAQTQYVPDLIKAKIVPHSNPLEVPVDYEINLPWPVSNAVYTQGHLLSQPAKDHYKVAWHSIKSTVADAVDGHSDFVGHENKTLWHYEAFVRPKSALAGLFEGTMKSDTIKTLQATLDAFNDWKAHNPARLKQSIDLWQQRFDRSTK